MPFVSVIDPKVTPIRLSSAVVRAFPIDPGLVFVERPLGVPLPPQIIGGVVAVAGPATVRIFGTHIAVVRSGSTIFGPDVFHTALRRDATVVFGPDTRV